MTRRRRAGGAAGTSDVAVEKAQDKGREGRAGRCTRGAAADRADGTRDAEGAGRRAPRGLGAEAGSVPGGDAGGFFGWSGAAWKRTRIAVGSFSGAVTAVMVIIGRLYYFSFILLR